MTVLSALRAPCCTPFCRRTIDRSRHPGCSEFICAGCWRAVPKTLKAIYRRARKALAAAEAADQAAYEAIVAGSLLVAFEEARCRLVWRAVNTDSRCRRLWAICKRRAVEAAAGLA